MANLQSFERAEYQQVKADLHRKILDRLDLEKLGRTTGDSAREEVLVVIRNAVNTEVVPLSFAERERLSREILDEIFGLGPLEPLLKDHGISDILVNRFDRVYIERAGKLELTGLSFKDNTHLMQIIERIVSRVGRRVDESSPMVDARLADPGCLVKHAGQPRGGLGLDLEDVHGEDEKHGEPAEPVESGQVTTGAGDYGGLVLG